jgi:hypothetical protein
MSTSDVRSIDSLIRLRHTLITLSGDWTDCLHQIKYAARRIEERFAAEVPAYWKHQATLAERSLTESLDNLSRLQSTSAGVSPGATEARMRVAKVRRRLALCQEKEKRSRQLALAVAQVCQELSGPIAEVSMHSEVNLPAAAEELARMIDHLTRYAEIQAPSASSQSLDVATGQTNPPPGDTLP